MIEWKFPCSREQLTRFGYLAPPTNQSLYNQWTIGPIFYSVLVIAETLGSSNNSQLIDLNANGNSVYTPGYAIYENGQLTKLALLNFMSDPSGANDYTATISLDVPPPPQIVVKYGALHRSYPHLNVRN